MSQVYIDDCYASGHTATTDLQSFENNFAALKSSFSGPTAPSNPVAGMLWFDTTKKLLKGRNNANGAWLGIMIADASHKIWVYRNTAPDGWVIDAAITDVVCALKGGSYGATGGAQVGTWTQPDHTLTAAEIPAHDHSAAGAHVHNIPTVVSGTGGAGVMSTLGGEAGAGYSADSNGSHTHTSVGSSGAHNHGSAYRPAAAVGTLQYMDI